MKNRPKILIILLVVTLTLSACTQTSQLKSNIGLEKNQKKLTSIILWHYYISKNQQMLEKEITEFNQTIGAENGIFVESIAKGSIADLETAVSNSAKGVINSEPMPDIFSSYPDKAIEIDALNKLANLDDYFSKEEKSEYISGFMPNLPMNHDKFLVIPVAKSTELFYLNATAWNKFATATNASLDSLSTWDGIAKTARQYYQWTDSLTPNIPWDGQSMLGLDSIPNYVLIANKQLGINMVDTENKSILLHLPNLKVIFDFYVKGMALEYLNASGKFRSDNIKSGELIAYTGSSSSAAYFPTWIEQKNQRKDIDFIALPYPKFEGGENIIPQQGAGMCIAKSTPEREAAAALFLKWFTSEKHNIAFAMNSGYLPVKTNAYKHPDFLSTLNKLKSGNPNQKNIYKVYEITITQIKNNYSYEATPFKGSYKIRGILQTTLSNAANDAKNKAISLKAKGYTEEQIIDELQMELRFQNWVNELKSTLNNEDLPYQEIKGS